MSDPGGYYLNEIGNITGMKKALLNGWYKSFFQHISLRLSRIFVYRHPIKHEIEEFFT